MIRKGFAAVRTALPEIIDDGENGLSGLMRELIRDLYERLNWPSSGYEPTT